MAQLLARIPDDLHRRLKQRAAAEQRTLNDVVTEALRSAADELSPRELIRRQLQVRGRLATSVEPPPSGPPPTDEEILESLGPGGGKAILDELDAERERGRA